MKTRTKTVVLIILLLMGATINAQFLKKLGERAEKAAENAVLRKTEQKVSKETEKAMDTILEGGTKRKKRPSKKGKDQEVAANENNRAENDRVDGDSPEKNTQAETPKPKIWSKYNFVPGDEVIFQDDLVSEENGEFPSRWDLIDGNAENASFEGENIINLKNNSIITPLMDKAEYLPEVFTIEFDAYFGGDPGPFTWQYYGIRFGPGSGSWYYPVQGSQNWYYPLNVYRHGANLISEVNGAKRDFETFEKTLKEKQPVWRHVAIAFSKRSLKVFVDQHRMLNIPNLGFKPKMFSIAATSYNKDDVRAIKNIRVAQGGKKLYDRVIADGKFTTRGILFDVNKATLKPSSMGVINEVTNMMLEHTDLKFSIEGHTDSDGDETHNLELSEKRAIAVKEALVNSGVDAARLQVKGIGESIPVSDNSTPEGKANNRRVEFVKL